MTSNEQKTIKDLYELVSQLRTENQKHRENINSIVSDINSKIEKKYTPIILEDNILKTAQNAIYDAITKTLSDYNSPLIALTKLVVDENSSFLKELISNSFNLVIKTEEFKQSIINAFSHKVARTIISNNDGLFDKVSNELKQDAIFKSKMSLAVSNVVEECLREKNNNI
jgi:hypothetical protein